MTSKITSMLLAVFATILILAIVINWPVIVLRWNLYQLDNEPTFSTQAPYGNRIGELVEERPGLSNVIVRQILEGRISSRSKTFLIPSLFVPEDNEAQLLDVLSELSVNAAANADLIGHFGMESFQSSRPGLGWRAFDILAACAGKNSDCLASSHAVLMSIPADQVSTGVSKLEHLSSVSDNSKRLAALTVYNWIRDGRIKSPIQVSDPVTNDELQKLGDAVSSGTFTLMSDVSN